MPDPITSAASTRLGWFGPSPLMCAAEGQNIKKARRLLVWHSRSAGLPGGSVTASSRAAGPLPAMPLVSEQDMHFGNRTGRCAAVPVPSYWRDRRVAKDNLSRRARHKTAPRGCCRSFVKRSSAPATATRVGAGVLYSRDAPHHVPMMPRIAWLARALAT